MVDDHQVIPQEGDFCECFVDSLASLAYDTINLHQTDPGSHQRSLVGVKDSKGEPELGAGEG
jgi:hypothetical protein